MPDNVIYQKRCYFRTYALEPIFVILHETKNLKPQEKRQKCAIPILYEAAQNGQPEILSGKGSILCSFTEKWYKSYIYFLSVAFNRQDLRKKWVETLIIAVIPILYEAAQNSQPEILSGKGSILCGFTEKWYKVSTATAHSTDRVRA